MLNTRNFFLNPVAQLLDLSLVFLCPGNPLLFLIHNYKSYYDQATLQNQILLYNGQSPLKWARGSQTATGLPIKTSRSQIIGPLGGNLGRSQRPQPFRNRAIRLQYSSIEAWDPRSFEKGSRSSRNSRKWTDGEGYSLIRFGWLRIEDWKHVIVYTILKPFVALLGGR